MVLQDMKRLEPKVLWLELTRQGALKNLGRLSCGGTRHILAF